MISRSFITKIMGGSFRVGICCPGVSLKINGTAAIHLAVKLVAERIYHSASGITTPDGKGTGGALYGKRVFVTDLTFGASVNPVLYEGGEPVFIDSEYVTWNMDPVALEIAFGIYPDGKIVIFVHLYGVPGKIEECKRIAQAWCGSDRRFCGKFGSDDHIV